MAIDINKVEEARETIRQAEKELMVLVKQYFENNRTLTFDLTVKESELPEFILSERRQWGRSRDLGILDLAKNKLDNMLSSGVAVNINIDNLSVRVEFSSRCIYGKRKPDCDSEDYVWWISWDNYKITCSQLKIWFLEPCRSKEFIIQEDQDVKFLCKVIKDAEAETNLNAKVEEEIIELHYKAKCDI